MMNVVFDVGNVLLRFRPGEFLASRPEFAPRAGDLLDTVFRSPEWLMLDRGELTAGEAVSVFRERRPDLSGVIAALMDSWTDMLTPIDDVVALLHELKKKGHGLYFLSNFHRGAAAQVTKKNAFFGLFDGGIFSCDVGLAKPDRAIYDLFLARFGLDAASCIFVDDVEDNVRAAEAAGMTGIVFASAAALTPALEALPR